MKPDINTIPAPRVHVITPRLTQPEEVDQILMAIAAQKAAVASFGVIHRKLPSRLPDHYLFAHGPDETALIL
jgi:hypothetical protein